MSMSMSSMSVRMSSMSMSMDSMSMSMSIQASVQKQCTCTWSLPSITSRLPAEIRTMGYPKTCSPCFKHVLSDLIYAPMFMFPEAQSSCWPTLDTSQSPKVDEYHSTRSSPAGWVKAPKGSAAGGQGHACSNTAAPLCCAVL
jgi:hypothetical protein